MIGENVDVSQLGETMGSPMTTKKKNIKSKDGSKVEVGKSSYVNISIPPRAMKELEEILKENGGTRGGVAREIFLHGLRHWQGITLKDGNAQSSTHDDVVALRAQVEVLKSLIAGKVA